VQPLPPPHVANPGIFNPKVAYNTEHDQLTDMKDEVILLHLL
jgi:hypothetical protein